MVCGILVPQPGIEPTPPALEVQGLICWTTREVPKATISGNVYSSCKVINLMSNYNSWENALFYRSKHPLSLYAFLIFSSTEFINIGCLMEKKAIWKNSCIYLQYVTCWFDTHTCSGMITTVKLLIVSISDMVTISITYFKSIPASFKVQVCNWTFIV